MTAQALDTAGLAELLGTTRHWVVRNAPRLPHHRLGRAYRFWPDDVTEILNSMRVRPAGDDMRPLPTRRRGG